jgi:hypothetical protein
MRKKNEKKTTAEHASYSRYRSLRKKCENNKKSRLSVKLHKKN